LTRVGRGEGVTTSGLETILRLAHFLLAKLRNCRIFTPVKKRHMKKNTPKYRHLIAVRNSRIQGKGVFALQRIRKGAKIIEYVGEVITNEEAERRYDDDKSERHHTFLFELDEDTCIDAAYGGNISRFINHSCSPNCEALIDGKHIYIFAKQNLQPGVELAYDYSYDVSARRTKALLEYYACHCGSPRCRGTILKPLRKKRKKSPTPKRK
jgi:uncharacterized protein